ncbi:MAG: hypothetical protein WCA38_10390 [Candidatus Acidiferrales bacterium]
MPAISDSDRSAFEDICKGVHDFNETEILCIHEAAQAVKAVVQSATKRQERARPPVELQSVEK